jgi:Flp pilus assembly protein TadD
LRTLFSLYPDDHRVLFNLGIMLCEQGRLQEAREVLKRLTRTAPDFVNGWNALGIALSREGKRKDASSAFQKSLSLDPENGYTLRNLGALMCRKDPQEALRYLKRAAKLLPPTNLLSTPTANLLDVGVRRMPTGAEEAITLNEHPRLRISAEARIAPAGT